MTNEIGFIVFGLLVGLVLTLLITKYIIAPALGLDVIIEQLQEILKELKKKNE